MKLSLSRKTHSGWELFDIRIRKNIFWTKKLGHFRQRLYTAYTRTKTKQNKTLKCTITPDAYQLKARLRHRTDQQTFGDILPTRRSRISDRARPSAKQSWLYLMTVSYHIVLSLKKVPIISVWDRHTWRALDASPLIRYSWTLHPIKYFKNSFKSSFVNCFPHSIKGLISWCSMQDFSLKYCRIFDLESFESFDSGLSSLLFKYSSMVLSIKQSLLSDTSRVCGIECREN